MIALITGASSGIGRDMARYLSSMGWGLILTATENSRSKLEALKHELDGNWAGTGTEIICCDLASENGAFELFDRCKGRNIDMIVNNAGFGDFGEFEKTDLKKELDMINVNIRALHILTKLFLKKFKLQNKGTILNVASSAGFMTGPLMATYYASKNYVVRLSLAIYEELRRSGSKVKICVFCPGPVDTNFNSRANVSFGLNGISSEYAARYAIDNALKGKTVIIPTALMKLGVTAARFVPLKLLGSIAYNFQHQKKR